MGRNALLASTLFAVIGSIPSNAADLVTQSDVVAVMTAVPREGAAHHALVKRQANETLNDLFERAFSECGVWGHAVPCHWCLAAGGLRLLGARQEIYLLGLGG